MVLSSIHHALSRWNIFLFALGALFFFPLVHLEMIALVIFGVFVHSSVALRIALKGTRSTDND